MIKCPIVYFNKCYTIHKDMKYFFKCFFLNYASRPQVIINGKHVMPTSHVHRSMPHVSVPVYNGNRSNQGPQSSNTSQIIGPGSSKSDLVLPYKQTNVGTKEINRVRILKPIAIFM